MKKEPVIKKIQDGYSFEVNGKPFINDDFDFDEQELIVCKCGNKTFWVYQPQAQYETDIICTKCYKPYTAHDG